MENKITGYIVTGKLRNGKKFKPMHYSNTTQGKMTAFGINLWNGSVWAKLDNGKRKLLKRVN